MNRRADCDASLVIYFLALVALLGDSLAIPYDKAHPKPRPFGGKCAFGGTMNNTHVLFKIFLSLAVFQLLSRIWYYKFDARPDWSANVVFGSTKEV